MVSLGKRATRVGDVEVRSLSWCSAGCSYGMSTRQSLKLATHERMEIKVRTDGKLIVTRDAANYRGFPTKQHCTVVSARLPRRRMSIV